MKILVDMNLSPEWVTVLTNHGLTVVHWATVGDPRAEDSAIMDWARANDHIVFTHDLDFGAMVAPNAGCRTQRHSSPHARRNTSPFGAGAYPRHRE